jgi:glycosyltransferase involved in cell wall biosynthesis
MNKTIIILEDIPFNNDILGIMKQEKNLEIFSLNYQTHKALSKLNLEHFMAETFLNDEDKKFIDKKAIQLSTTWYNHKDIQKILSYEEIPLPNLIENEISQYLSPILKNALCILRIIEKKKPSTIISYTILNDFVEQICQSKNISLNKIYFDNQPKLVLDKINIKFNLGLLPISFTVSRKFYSQIKNIFEKIINLFFNFNPQKNSIKKNILLLDFNPIPYEPLLKQLSKLDRNIILLNQRRPAIWNLKSFLIIKKSNCKIFNLNSYGRNIKLKISNDLNQFQNNLNLLFKKNFIFEELFLVEGFTLWPSIKTSFFNICNSRLSESIKRISSLKIFINDFKFSVILEWAEAGQEEKEVLFLANQKKIPSVMLQHAIVTTSSYWAPFARFLGDFADKLMSSKQAVWDKNTKEYALTFGHKNENIFVSGSPKFDKLFNDPKKFESKGIILFAPVGPTTVSVEYSNSSSFENFDNFVRQICKVAKNFPDKQLIVKPHPRPDFLNNIQNLINEIDPKIKITFSTNILKLIAECDVLITTNNSTIALESLILGKPTISLQTEKWALEEKISKSGAIIPISNLGDVEKILMKIFTDKNFKRNLLDRSQKYVAENLSFRGNASQTLANFLNSF